MNEKLHTKFGTAKLRKDYYQITTRKEGNHGKMLHRLIFEDFYNCEIPEGYHIHHKNGIKTDNCILNLQLMRASEHNSLHNSGKKHNMYGKQHSQKSKELMSKNTSKARNTTNYYRVSKQKQSDCKQGFLYKYQYSYNNKHKAITSVNIEKLKEKVLAKGLPWSKI